MVTSAVACLCNLFSAALLDSEPPASLTHLVLRVALVARCFTGHLSWLASSWDVFWALCSVYCEGCFSESVISDST